MTFQPLESRRLFSLLPLGGPTAVPGPTSIKNYDLAVAGTGQFIVATIEDGSTPKLTAVRYDAIGVPIGKPITLDTIGVNFNIPAVSADMDADGDAVVTYLADKTHLYAIRISKTGVVSPRQLIDAASGGESEFSAPSVSMDDGGGFFVAWIPYLSSGDNETVHVRAYDAAGVARGSEFVADGPVTLRDLSDPHVAAYPDGSGAVVAHTASAESGQTSIRYRLVGPTAVVGTVRTYDYARIADVAAYPDKSFAIAFLRPNFSQTPDGQVQRFDSVGDAVGEARYVAAIATSRTDNDVRALSIEASPDGGFVAELAVMVDGTLSNYAGKFGWDIPGASNVERIGTGEARSTAVGVAANGRAVVGWLQSGSVDVAGGLIVQRLVPNQQQAGFVENGILYIFGLGSYAARISQTEFQINVLRTFPDIQPVETSDSFSAAGVNAVDVSYYDTPDTITLDIALPSTVRGGGGSETIFGGTLEDRILGGEGNDEIFGRGGADRLYGEDGVDSLYGNGGNDRLEGGAQGDHMRGNDGKDMMFGNGGHDRMYGSANADRLYGQDGNDQLFGEGGNDRLYGDDGFSDFLYGGAGDDVFITVDNAFDYLYGDGGDDFANADAEDFLTSVTLNV